MRLHVDEEADAQYLRLDDSAIVESEEVRPGIVVGVEILKVKERNTLADLWQIHVDLA